MPEVKKSKCAICGHFLQQLKGKRSNSSRQDLWFPQWKKKCSESLCQVLLGSNTKCFRQYFKTGEYCSSCLQTTRDINLTWSQLKCLEDRLNKLSHAVLQNLKTNYDAIEEKTNPEIVEDSKTFLEIYSEDQQMEIIYSVASKHAALSATLIFPDLRIKDESCTESENAEEILSLEVKLEDNYQIECIEKYEEDSLMDGFDDRPPKSISTDRRLMRKTTLRERQSIRTRKRKNEVKYDYKEASSADENESDQEYIIPDDVAQSDCESDDSFNPKPPTVINKRSIRASKSKSPPPRKKNKYYKYVKKPKVRIPLCPTVKCPVCNKTINRQGFTLHQRTHTGEKPFSCPDCGKLFSDKAMFWKHARLLHGKLNPEGTKIKRPEIAIKVATDLASRKRRYYCDLCSWDFNYKYRYLRHLKDTHLNKEVKDGDSFFFYYCDVDNCPCSFTSLMSLTSHFSDVHSACLVNNAAFECNMCKRMFVQENNLQTHMKSHEENNIGCEFCHMTFSSLEEMKNHKHRHEIQFKLSDYCHMCAECGEGFTNNQMLTKHTLKLHVNVGNKKKRIRDGSKKKGFFCNICQKGFYQSNLENHMYTHTHPEGFKCSVCSEVKSTPKLLAQHKEKEHDRRNKTFNTPGTKVKCDISSKIISKSHYGEHKKRHAKPSLNNPCLHCHKTFKSLDELEIHKEEFHPPLPPKLVNMECKCEACNLDFKLEEEFRKHIIENHTEHYKTTHPYVCTFCWWVFKNIEDRNTHEEKLHNRQMCLICQIMVNVSDFENHVMSHTSSDSDGIQCPYCDTKHPTLNYLQYHLKRVHPPDLLDLPPKFITDYNKTKCEICNKNCGRNIGYRKHLVDCHPEEYEATHPYVCRHCWRVFRTEKDRQFHMEKSHDSAHDYKCSVENCGKLFSNRQHLLAHLNVHYKQKPYECPHCGKGFAQDGNCRSHINMVHTKHRSFLCKLCPNNEGYYVRKEFSKHVQKVHPEIPQHDYSSVLVYRKPPPPKIIVSKVSDCYLECPPVKRQSRKP